MLYLSSFLCHCCWCCCVPYYVTVHTILFIYNFLFFLVFCTVQYPGYNIPRRSLTRVGVCGRISQPQSVSQSCASSPPFSFFLFPFSFSFRLLSSIFNLREARNFPSHFDRSAAGGRRSTVIRVGEYGRINQFSGRQSDRRRSVQCSAVCGACVRGEWWSSLFGRRRSSSFVVRRRSSSFVVVRRPSSVVSRSSSVGWLVGRCRVVV